MSFKTFLSAKDIEETKKKKQGQSLIDGTVLIIDMWILNQKYPCRQLEMLLKFRNRRKLLQPMSHIYSQTIEMRKGADGQVPFPLFLFFPVSVRNSNGITHLDEWEKIRKPDDPLERPEEKYDPRSLFVVLL